MHRLLSLGALGALVALVGCDPVKDNRPLDAPTAPDADVDAAPDAAPDAPPAPVADYDIGYVNEMTFNSNTTAIGISSFVVVVNRGMAPLVLAMTDVPQFSDDNATVGWTFAKAGTSMTMLPAGQSAGELSPLATTRIIDSGLVSETRVMGTGFNFSMQFSAIPSGTTFNLNGQATISIEGKRITLPFTIHFVPGASTAFNNASRIHAP